MAELGFRQEGPSRQGFISWNRLPTELKLLRSTDSFLRDLKTFLFDSVYGTGLRSNSVMRPRSSSRGRNTSASVTVTVTVTVTVLRPLTAISFPRAPAGFFFRDGQIRGLETKVPQRGPGVEP